MRPPFHFLLPGCFFPFLSPALPPGAVLPSFNDFSSIGMAEYQGITVLHSHSRYLTVKGIQATNYFIGGFSQNIFRNLLGRAEGFPL